MHQKEFDFVFRTAFIDHAFDHPDSVSRISAMEIATATVHHSPLLSVVVGASAVESTLAFRRVLRRFRRLVLVARAQQLVGLINQIVLTVTRKGVG